jgi:hypothetical protein
MWKSGNNEGSRLFAVAIRQLRDKRELTTLVSYSDPSAGHTGAIYKACNWIWAPTWHRLKPPPTGNGIRGGVIHSVKDRWVFPLRKDERRVMLLGTEYREPKWRALR